MEKKPYDDPLHKYELESALAQHFHHEHHFATLEKDSWINSYNSTLGIIPAYSGSDTVDFILLYIIQANLSTIPIRKNWTTSEQMDRGLHPDIAKTSDPS